MKYPIAIEEGSETQAYGVVVPDIPGCYSAGDTLDEAMDNAKEAICLHLEMLAEEGVTPPQASQVKDHVKNAAYAGWVWAVIDIDPEPFLGKSEKVNVTLPRLLTYQIDNLIKQDKRYTSRSHFLQVAAMHELHQR
ncbi:type II toxin-antitoxin system HicB family antitoxin [Pokkaliibacter sp. MBI-7]|uniref:type II toxin-antitoxin system HicB family antitoxin n=1 Tax=Pokkaliibacter sp. MBI-7 TaxID=3040600 RepID=UPI00244BC13B|nr:type II toxin-antitoxin system HicB family antitoxin [Pokkaliibacter sp. MBI-7]MDH2435636.1 type II toxin-antitoxin system HicB family antitoxin [Pokkaliibacter sp. MBI-7]